MSEIIEDSGSKRNESRTESPDANLLSVERPKKPNTSMNSSKRRIANLSYDANQIRSRSILSPIPNIEPRAEKYIPMPYIFRLPAVTTQNNVKNQSVRCPPFSILLDHSLSVIWNLYSKEEYGKPLGINQLQWALQFLNNIKDSEGKHPKDVAHCIKTISDALIELYADLVNDVKGSSKSQEKKLKHQPVATSSAAQLVTDNISETEPGSPSYDEIREREDDLMIRTNVPFSVNYADMINRCPEKESDVINASRGMDKDNMIKFLCQWKKDQTEKIFAELDRLSSIEEYLGNATNNYDPELCPEDRELHALLTERIKRRTDERQR